MVKSKQLGCQAKKTRPIRKYYQPSDPPWFEYYESPLTVRAHTEANSQFFPGDFWTHTNRELVLVAVTNLHGRGNDWFDFTTRASLLWREKTREWREELV